MSIETNSYLSKKQKRYKFILGMRVLFVPLRWMRLKKPNISKEDENNILNLLIMSMDKIDVVMNDNEVDTSSWGREPIYKHYTIKVGNINFWNANYPYSSGEFDIDLTKNVPSRYFSTRKISLALSDLVKLIKDKENNQQNGKNGEVKKAVSDSILDIHL